MPEYLFPSGRLTTAFNPLDWVAAFHAAYLAVLVGLLALLIWRCRRPASWWDLFGWVALIIADLAVFDGLFGNFPAFRQQMLPDRFWLPALVLIAVTITLFRLARSWPARLAVCVVVYFGLIYVLFPTYSTPREVARRQQCKNQLKQIGMAMHNYHEVFQQFPYAGGTVPDTGPVCSWRMALSVYLQATPYYHWYHFDEPWDSPFNVQIQEKCPPDYHCPSHQSERRFTDFAMLRGPGTIGGDGLTATKISDMADGTSHTAIIVEASGREIIWTEPKDVEVTDASLGVNLPGDRPGRSRAIISSYHVGGAHAVLGDGTVRFVNQKIDKSVLKALTTINGGETAPEF